MEDSPKTVLRSAKRFFSGTFLSRLTGMFREVFMAAAFGAAPAVAAFMMAFRFSNLLRRVFGEGAMQNAFVPHFEEIRRKDPLSAGHFFHSLSFLMGSILLLIVIIAEICLFSWLKWGSLTSGNAEIITYTMLMLPGLVFICLFGLNTSLLQCENYYFLSSFAPVVFNLIWIVAIIFFRHKVTSEAMLYLSFAMTLALAGQWMMTSLRTRRIVRNHLNGERRQLIFSTEFVVLAKTLSLSVIGVAATQINSALDTIFARVADVSGPAYLWYAIRLQQVPFALFGLAISGALLPSLSRAMKCEDEKLAKRLFTSSIKKNFSAMVPATVVLFVMGASVVNLFYGRGSFDLVATKETIYCLWGYAVGLCPMTLILVFAAAFYVRGDYITPTIATIISVFFNIFLNAFFVFVMKWNSVSVALATSFSSFLNLFILGLFLQKKIDNLKSFINPFLKVLFISILAGSIVIVVGNYLKDNFLLVFYNQLASFPRSFFVQFKIFLVEGLVFVVSLFSLAKIFKEKDLLSWFM